MPRPIYFKDDPSDKVINQPSRDELDIKIDSMLYDLDSDVNNKDKELQYLMQPAPNIVEWVTGIEYWNVPSTFQYWGQYQLLRDLFNLRCRICNSQRPDKVDCWGKSKFYLESEVLLVWDRGCGDFVCPKCRSTMREFLNDGIIIPYNELVAVVGMRGGKSYTGAHIAGYFEHLMINWGIEKPGNLQKKLGQEKSEWFEINFAATTEKQVEKTIYSKYRQMRRNSPWINRYMNWIKNKEKEQIGVKDPWKYGTPMEEIYDGYLQIRFNRLASDSSGIAGATRIATFLDEWARLINTEGTRSAGELYRVFNQGLRTIRSAVMLDSRLPYFLGFMAALTSAIAADDPAMQTLAMVKDGTLKKTFALHKSTWDFNPKQPRSAFDEEYDRDPIAAERDFGANPPTAITPFISDTVRFWKSIDWEKRPIATFINTFPSDPTGREYVGINLGHCDLDTVNNYYIFGDAGLSLDTFSLACGHSKWVMLDEIGEDSDKSGLTDSSGRILPSNQGGIVWPEEIGTFIRPDRGGDTKFISKMHQERMRMMNYESSTPTSGSPYEHRGEVLCTEIDFCVRIIPQNNRNVWFDSIVDIIEKLRKKIKITTVCFDRWNSVSTIQQIRSMGIQSYEVSLKVPDDFLKFRDMVYNGRVFMLPPDENDKLNVDDTGRLVIGAPQEFMSGHGVALVELLKLSRSPDLKKIYNVNKGKVRGRDSDDVARCIIGLHHIIQNSVVDNMANTKGKREVRKRLQANENPMSGNIYRGNK